MQVDRRKLHERWRVKPGNPRGGSPCSELDWVPATVPGHVHLDLVRAGVIADPFRRLYERTCAWVDEDDWVYETTFTLEDVPANAYLRFSGLDTVADIELNGELLGRADNMFVPYEFAVGEARASDSEEAETADQGGSEVAELDRPDPPDPPLQRSSAALRSGENTLRVTFQSALREGRRRQQAWIDATHYPAKPHWFLFGPRAFVRKAQYMFGWDWGPELISCGIWRPVELVTVPVARLLEWRHVVDLSQEGRAVVTVTVEVERAPGHEETPLAFTLAVTEVAGEAQDYDDPLPGPASVDVPTGSGRVQATASVTIENPRLWWPNGYLPELHVHSPLYRLRMALLGEGEVDSRDARIGLRTLDLVRQPDPDGSGESFRFRVNGRDIFAKGANWVPAHSFPSWTCGEQGEVGWFLHGDQRGEDRDELVRQRVFDACDAGMNMLRVWGGGLYESDYFYELCDEHGILVWQDFPYACSYYPDEDAYADIARQEAAVEVRRLRHHPSLALWCGNNENDMMWHDGWAGPDHSPPRFLGDNLYQVVLPAVVATEDPGRAYWASSPYGGNSPNSQSAGDRHNWDVWHGGGDWTRYADDHSRFLSEFGFASSCGMEAWAQCLAEEDRWPRSPAVRWHDKTQKGYDRYLGYITAHFPEPVTLEDLVYYTQIAQAEALRFGIEHWRREKDRCGGTLFWQLNDCWPVQSWAVVDFAGTPKAAWYAAKRFYAPVLLTLVREGDIVAVHLTSDLPEHLQGDVTVSLETFDGDVLRSETLEAYVDADASTRVGEVDIAAMRGHERDVYVYARLEPYWDVPGVEAVENYLFLAEPKDLRLGDAGITVEVAGPPNLARSEVPYREVVLTARRFAPWVWVRLEGAQRLQEGEHDDNWFHLRPGQAKRLRVYPFPHSVALPADLRARLRVRSL